MKDDDKSKLSSAYQQMMSRAKEAKEGNDSVEESINTAREKAVELEELSHEESHKIATYLKRDLDDAAHFIVETENALADWLKFDLTLLENRLEDILHVMVDHTREELDNLAERAHQASEWNSGEISGPGSLFCNHCNKKISFHKPNYIPPCPNCGATSFTRQFEEESE